MDIGHQLKSTVLAASLVLLSATAGAAPLPGQIVVDTGNRAWLKYSGGGPFFLAAPGDPEGFLYRGSRNSDGTRNGDQQALIQKISGTGSNGIYFQVIRSHGGDGDSTHNPFINNDPAQGLNTAVLDQWDGWFTQMDANDIVVYLFIYDDSARVWNTGDSVGSDERAFLQAIVNRFEHIKHLIWVVAEEYGERFSPARVSAMASVIRNADDHDHPIAVHKNHGLDFSEFANDANIDQFAVQYNETSASTLHSGVVSAWNKANGRYSLNMSEATQWGSGSEARRKAWAVALGGAYVMGLGMDIAGTPTSDLEDLGRLRSFMESTDFNTMSPHDNLGTADTDYVLANPGNSYIVYGDNVSNLGLSDMTAGVYDLRWFDPASGTTVTESAVQLSGGTNTFSKPSGIGGEAALYAKRTGDATGNPPPAAPTNLSVE